MESTLLIEYLIALENGRPNFVNLKGKLLGEYKIVYHINNCYSIKSLSGIKFKNQLLFQKFSSKNQQMNLVLVDSFFPVILADLALEVLLNEKISFHQYIQTKKTMVVIDSRTDKDYFKYKFFMFIHHLLYSEIASEKVCKGETMTEVVYCLKGRVEKIDFYSYYEQCKLQLLLLKKLKLEIDLGRSTISKDSVSLCLKIFVE